MVMWHRSRGVDLGLRVFGLILCGTAYLAIRQLVALPTPALSADAIAYVLAAMGFVGASAGSALLMLGHHLFDKVEVGERWRKGPDPSRTGFPENMTVTGPALLVVGKNVDGSSATRLVALHMTGAPARPVRPTETSPEAPARIGGRSTLRTG